MFRQFDKRRRAVPLRRGLAAAAAALMVAGTGVGVFTGAQAAAPTGPAGHIQTVAGNMQNFQQFGYSGDGGPASSGPALQPPGHRLRPERRRLHRRRPQPADPQDRRQQRDQHLRRQRPARLRRHAAERRHPHRRQRRRRPGPAAVFNQPHGVAVDSKGNVYIADSNNQRLRKVDAGTGTITTIAGTGDPKAPPCPDKARRAPPPAPGSSSRSRCSWRRATSSTWPTAATA